MWQKANVSSVINKNADDKTVGKLYYNLNVDLLKKKLSAKIAKASGSTSYEILVFDDASIKLDCCDSTSQVVLPIEALKTFLGEDPQGVWTFRARDRYTT